MTFTDTTDEMTEHNRKRLHSRGICVIIPTYNNATTIHDVVMRAKVQCDDVIVVNDGCTDETASILAGIGGITVVDMPKNSGKGAALRAGFRKALMMGFAYAITLDADGQHFPEDIPLLLEANIANPGALLIGERKGLDGVERSGGSKFANAFSNFWFCVQTLHYLRDTQTGYRLYPLRKQHCLGMLTSRYEAELELLVFSAWHGVKIVPVPVNVYYPPREERVSHFRPAYDFTRIFILNTCLCFLALCYALPLVLLRGFAVMMRTLYALLFFIVVSLLYLLPASVCTILLCRDHAKRTDILHKHLFAIGRLVMHWHGIPGVKLQVDNPHGEDFTKPAVIISNHQSVLDLMAMLSFTSKVIVLTKDWVYHNPFFGLPLRYGEFYPVTEGLDAIMPRLQSLVERGYSIAVYPEGTRSDDLAIQRFRQGAFYIAEQLRLDVLPLVEYAPGRALPKGGWYLRKGIFNVEIDRRMAYEAYSAHGAVKNITSWFRRYYLSRYDEMRDKLDRYL